MLTKFCFSELEINFFESSIYQFKYLRLFCKKNIFTKIMKTFTVFCFIALVSCQSSDKTHDSKCT
jgi:hypothetical protein